MFSTLGLSISFILWKVLMLVLLGIGYLWMLIVGFVFSHESIGDDEVFNPSAGAIILPIALILSIPYWNMLNDSKPVKSATAVLMESFNNHVEDATPTPPVVRTNQALEIRRFELVDFNPPKHFYVKLEDVKTREVFNQVYVSKHCNNYTKLIKGEEYNLRVTKYTLSDQPGKVFAEFHGLYDAFC